MHKGKNWVVRATTWKFLSGQKKKKSVWEAA